MTGETGLTGETGFINNTRPRQKIRRDYIQRGGALITYDIDKTAGQAGDKTNDFEKIGKPATDSKLYQVFDHFLYHSLFFSFFETEIQKLEQNALAEYLADRIHIIKNNIQKIKQIRNLPGLDGEERDNYLFQEQFSLETQKEEIIGRIEEYAATPNSNFGVDPLKGKILKIMAELAKIYNLESETDFYITDKYKTHIGQTQKKFKFNDKPIRVITEADMQEIKKFTDTSGISTSIYKIKEYNKQTNPIPGDYEEFLGGGKKRKTRSKRSKRKACRRNTR